MECERLVAGWVLADRPLPIQHAWRKLAKRVAIVVTLHCDHFPQAGGSSYFHMLSFATDNVTTDRPGGREFELGNHP